MVIVISTGIRVASVFIAAHILNDVDTRAADHAGMPRPGAK